MHSNEIRLTIPAKYVRNSTKIFNRYDEKHTFLQKNCLNLTSARLKSQ